MTKPHSSHVVPPAHHIPVLLDFISEKCLMPRDRLVLDATLGEGGHTLEFLKRNKSVIAVERDPEILSVAKKRIVAMGFSLSDVVFYPANYGELNEMINPHVNIDFALFDLGVSLFHYRASGRGFSFQREEPLDMRLDGPLSEDTLTAQRVIATYPKHKIIEILREYGEEKFAYKISDKICSLRKTHPISTSRQLADVICSAVPSLYHQQKIHPATRTFQALRIYINSELKFIQNGILAVAKRLKTRGRIAVISYHSLEDRIVKNTFKSLVPPKKNLNKYRQNTNKSSSANFKIHPFIITPEPTEIAANKAARSAKMRILYRE